MRPASACSRASPATRAGPGNPTPAPRTPPAGSIRSRHCGATVSRAVPRGANAHLCRLPTQKSAPMPAPGWTSCPGRARRRPARGTPCSRATPAMRGDREELGGRRGDLIDDEQPGPPGSQAGADRLHDLARRWRPGGAAGPGDRAGAAAPADARPRRRTVVGGQHLVTGLSVPATGAPRRRRWWCWPPGAAVRVGAEEGGQVPAGVREAVEQPPGEEPQRVGLHLVAQPLLGALHRDRHRAERAVVEVADRRVEGEEQAGARERLRGLGDARLDDRNRRARAPSGPWSGAA